MAQEGASLGTYDWDIARNRISWSPKMFELYGLPDGPDGPGRPPAPEALLTAWRERLHPEDRDRCEAELRQLIEGGTSRLVEMSFRVIHPETGLRWIEGRGQVLRDAAGRALRLTGVNFDVTERRAAEAARERAAMMLGMSIEVAAIGTWEYDPEADRVTASARTLAMFGLPEDAASLPKRAWLDLIHPSDRDAVREALLTIGEEGAETAQVFRLAGAGGAPRWISARGRMVRPANGHPRLIGAMTDITETKRREHDREAALEHRQTLLAELNHRMKNNLHLILSMLRLEATRSDRPEAFGAATERIAAVADLHAQLGFAEGAGRVGFGDYLEDLATKLRHSVLSGTDIRLDCEAARVDLALDRAVPLGLVVNELVTNAIKYAFPTGRGRIGLRLEQTAQDELLVVVEDDGCGPDAPGDAPGDAVERGAPCGGSGLGSRLVTGLCEQIGARIESRALPGLRHEIRLPLRD